MYKVILFASILTTLLSTSTVKLCLGATHITLRLTITNSKSSLKALVHQSLWTEPQQASISAYDLSRGKNKTLSKDNCCNIRRKSSQNAKVTAFHKKSLIFNDLKHNSNYNINKVFIFQKRQIKKTRKWSIKVNHDQKYQRNACDPPKMDGIEIWHGYSHHSLATNSNMYPGHSRESRLKKLI